MAAVRFLLLLLLVPAALSGQEIVLTGRVLDPSGTPLSSALVQVFSQDQILAGATSGEDGRFTLKLTSIGEFVIKAQASGFRTVVMPISVRKTNNSLIPIRMSQIAPRVENITVSADVNTIDVLSPDPAEKVFVRQDLLDANPGRPGAPVSIPGYPIETASSGIKAPQYFAPGVAGDHGEPIAQYIAVGSYWFRTISQRTRTATAIPIRTYSSRRCSKVFR